MSDALPDDAWVSDFLATAPKPLHAALQRRLQASTTHVNTLAEIFKQRAAIEAQYADSLAKLARAAESGSVLPKSSIEWDKTSGEAKVYDTIVSEIRQVSAHYTKIDLIPVIRFACIHSHAHPLRL